MFKLNLIFISSYLWKMCYIQSCKYRAAIQCTISDKLCNKCNVFEFLWHLKKIHLIYKTYAGIRITLLFSFLRAKMSAIIFNLLITENHFSHNHSEDQISFCIYPITFLNASKKHIFTGNRLGYINISHLNVKPLECCFTL